MIAHKAIMHMMVLFKQPVFPRAILYVEIDRYANRAVHHSFIHPAIAVPRDALSCSGILPLNGTFTNFGCDWQNDKKA